MFTKLELADLGLLEASKIRNRWRFLPVADLERRLAPGRTLNAGGED